MRCTRGDWKNIHDSLDVKINTLEKMQTFQGEKDVLPENKPVICICNVTQNIFMWDILLKLQHILAPKLIDHWLRGLWLI